MSGISSSFNNLRNGCWGCHYIYQSYYSFRINLLESKRLDLCQFFDYSISSISRYSNEFRLYFMNSFNWNLFQSSQYNWRLFQSYNGFGADNGLWGKHFIRTFISLLDRISDRRNSCASFSYIHIERQF